MKPISVSVFRPDGRAFFQAQWNDPITGRRKRRSLGTAVKREAERVAGTIEKELRAGTYRDPLRTTWEDFRKRLESEYAPAKAEGTRSKLQAMFNAVERHVDPKFVSLLNADQISKFQKSLRDGDKLAEPTIKGHMAEWH
jgi:hypothetical protein